MLEHLPLCMNYAKKFSRSFPSLRHEMISEALYVLVLAWEKQRDHPNFVGYLKTRLHGAMIDLIRSECHLVPYEDVTAHIAHRTMESYLVELFETGEFTPVEQEIVRKRVEGYTDQEIADLTGSSQTAVNRTRLNLCKKVKGL